MVAFNTTDIQSLRDHGRDILLESLRRSHEHIVRAKWDEELKNAVSKIGQWLDSFRDAAAKHENVFETHETRITEDVVREWSDDQLLDHVHQFGMVAEAIHTWNDIIDQNLNCLHKWKTETGVWSDAAELLVARMEKLSRIFNWNTDALYQWMNQLGTEYLRRNPDLPALPAEPLDLGPTNSARLPQVL